MEFDHTEKIEGPYGVAEWIPLPPASDPNYTEASRNTIALAKGSWLITSPGWHPIWHQYVLNIISLADAPNVPPAKLKFMGATHELLLVAIDPAAHLNLNNIIPYYYKGNLPFLNPVNIAEQFEATDDEMQQLAWLACRAIVFGGLNPETADAPARIREDWLIACTKGLAHIRGEEHAP